MRASDATLPMFARHETFHPRYSWFRKAYKFVVEDPMIFYRDDAPLLMGVGKNMVRSIRFWGIAAKLIEEKRLATRPRSKEMTTTSLGDSLFGESGWDRYMEDPGTLWLLHWLLLAPPSLLPVWWIAFNIFTAIEFDEDDLLSVVSSQIESIATWNLPHRTSLRKDIGVLVRTYAPPVRTSRKGLDDILDCPLRELHLIDRAVGVNRYRFSIGVKPALPIEILGFATLDYCVRASIGGNTITLDRLANEPGAPGRVFQLSEQEYLASLELVVGGYQDMALSSTTGATQFSWSDDPRNVATKLLDRYYGSSTTEHVIERGLDEALETVPDAVV